MHTKILLLLLGCCFWYAAQAQKTIVYPQPQPAAYDTGQYLPLLKGKRVALFANNTTITQNGHLLDVLVRNGIRVQKIFGPEHGFRGGADAGAKVSTETDAATGIQIVSLYGKSKKPSKTQLADVDVVVFDIQDVGVRFYTYISSLEELMKGCIDAGVPVMILDRPNPNGQYIDGPILDTNFRSFVGMQTIPVVHGMTMGEYARMLIGEKWLQTSKPYTQAALQVIQCKNYTHRSEYILPVKPSPNIPDNSVIYLYPGTCFFEGTILSEGRGTIHPFAYIGHPKMPDSMFAFTPVSMPGATKPKLVNEQCFGYNLYDSNYRRVQEKVGYKIPLSYLLDAYKKYPQKDSFFIRPAKGTQYFFDKLAGSASLRNMMVAGKQEKEIRKSWAPGLAWFARIRSKYLLYP